MSDEDKIIEIPRSDLPQLRDLFKQDWPKHIIGHDLVNNYIRWFEQDPNFDEAKFYALNGDCSDGTFIVIVSTILVKFYFLLMSPLCVGQIRLLHIHP